VGATAPLNQANFDRLASYTNYGKTSVDLMAPGGEDLNTVSTEPRDAILSACSSYAAACGVFRYGSAGARASLPPMSQPPPSSSPRSPVTKRAATSRPACTAEPTTPTEGTSVHAMGADESTSCAHCSSRGAA
jgi:hypothetical protein